MAGTTTPRAQLTKCIKQIPSVPGWDLTITATKKFSISTPRGRVLLPPSEEWSDDSAETFLNRLNDKGLETALARNGTAKPKTPAKRAPAGAAPQAQPAPAPGATPPVYEGDASPDEGLVQRDLHLTPAVAEQLLSRPWEAVTSKGRHLVQRRTDPENVEAFEALLINGEFAERLYQGLAIGENGSLYDGKHRCIAVKNTGISVWVKVTYNFPADDVLAVDSGRQRRTSTKLEMEQYEHPLMLGSAARLLHYVDEFAAALSLGPEAANDVPHDWRKWCNKRVSDRTVRKIVHDNDPQLYEDHLWAFTHKQDVRENQLMVPAVTVFRFTARRAWPEKELKEFDKKLSKFLDAVLFKIGITTSDHIALTLHRWQSRQTPRLRFNREAQLNALTKAWNMYVDPPNKTGTRTIHPSLPGVFALPIAGNTK